jgi:hypothetical protein
MQGALLGGHEAECPRGFGTKGPRIGKRVADPGNGFTRTDGQNSRKRLRMNFADAWPRRVS